MNDSEIRRWVDHATDQIIRVVAGSVSKDQLREIERIMENLQHDPKNR